MVVLLPSFDDRGLLPPGDYPVTFSELRLSPLVENDLEGWHRDWRLQLVNQAEVLVRQLCEVGVDDIVLDGSFVEDKLRPNDIDDYFTCDATGFGRIVQHLNTLDPHKVWTWEDSARKPYGGRGKRQLPMWHRYRVELFPHFNQFSGILDGRGHPLTFPSAFRQQRGTYEEKGVIKPVREGGSR